MLCRKKSEQNAVDATYALSKACSNSFQRLVGDKCVSRYPVFLGI